MSPQDLPLIKSHDPATFLERGVAVPFTTPMLVGSRARTAGQHGVDLVVPNPSGGRGVYVLPWSALTSFCRPTLHDRALSEQIATQGKLTPSKMRGIACAVAATGLAGEDARDAALVASERDKDARLLANYRLLTALMQQLDVPPTAGAAPAVIEAHGRQAVALAARRLGRPAAWVATAMEDAAAAMAQIGIGDSPGSALVPRTLDLLQQVRAGVTAWSVREWSEDLAAYANLFDTVATFTQTTARKAWEDARALTRDAIHLLQSWGSQNAEVLRLAARPEWLLDGWEQICLVWNYAEDDAARRAALVEMVQLIPIVPREWLEGSGLNGDGSFVPRLSRRVMMNKDWRTGAAIFDLIARNEFFRAATLQPTRIRRHSTDG